MTIAVTGGTGFVGQAFLDRTGDAGLLTRSLARTPPADRRSGNIWLPGGLHDRAALSGLVEGVDTLVHIAGITTSHDPQVIEAGNVQGTANLLEAARESGARRFIFVSSLAAREPDLSRYGASKATAEDLVRASGLDWTIVRPPAVYGPRDRDMLALFRAARWGVVPAPKQGRASLIHVDDLARLLLTLSQGSTDTAGMLLEPDDGLPEGWEHRDLALAIGEAVGRRPLILGQTPRSLRWGAHLDRLLNGDKAKLTHDRARYLAHPDWVVSAANRVPEKLWLPELETREGLKATARWYRENRWL